jgi:hypothetical protein
MFIIRFRDCISDSQLKILHFFSANGKIITWSRGTFLDLPTV